MKVLRTLRVKITADNDLLERTIIQYSQAFNHICAVGYEDNDFNRVSLHHKTYKDVRQYLPSQLAVSARQKAAEALKPAIMRKKAVANGKLKLRSNQKLRCPKAKNASIRYDARSYSLWLDQARATLSTIEGRIDAKLHLCEWHKQYLSWNPKSAELIIRKNGTFLNIVFEKDEADIVISDTPTIIGIDRGIVNLAVTSSNQFYGKNIISKTHKYQRLKRELQKCGSKSAKRHLRKVKSKEHRFLTDVNHCTSKAIVNSLESGDIIVLEKLTDIRKKVKLRRKERRKLHKWPFYQLDFFLTYKAEARGITVDYTDPRYTSQKCSKCGHTLKANRLSRSAFKCRRCDFRIDADLNAARNIELNYRDANGYPGGLSVNQPIVGIEETKPQSGNCVSVRDH